MKCPFELPVEANVSAVDSDNRYITGKNGFPFIFGDVKKEYADYIVQVINSHKKLVGNLKNVDNCLAILANTKSEEGMSDFPGLLDKLWDYVKQALEESENK